MNYVLKKIITLIITIFLITVFTFTAFEVIPGDSVLTILGMDATEERIQEYREALGYNQSIPVRYINWLKAAMKGDFGTSVKPVQMPVNQLIKDRLPVTISLAFLAFIMIIIVSLPLGIYTARKKDKFIDRIILIFNQIGMAIPPFFLGMILSLVFGVILKWFVPGKFIGPEENFFEFMKYLIFPAIAVAIPKIAILVKFLRSSILRQMELDYVRTARSKGLKEKEILYKHVLKNALIPVITLMAMILADILAGTILVEQVFNLPGLGRLLVVAISNRDFSVVQAIILYIAIVVVGINFMVDILYQWIDPRVNVQSK